jgi:protein-L-isoaspartate(D-aspartate) O-methyltransferase
VKAKKALDVGSGSGYLTLAFAKMMPKDGISYGIEHIPQLVQSSKENIKK